MRRVLSVKSFITGPILIGLKSDGSERKKSRAIVF